ncbi:hypothetical protein DPX16_6838 [Anabarilius grahami]|uniref:Uncharacterized protein n=1 Tax=Anabarilius grahami TaxID=495550 RepID=A0A3N0Y6G5_ANAGA|nr:hypothetical protein DPX16_6838 [Anabarilius grahami]
MSLTVSQDEGTTVITVTSNPNSKWPVLCQILGSLFCSDSPVCSVSEDSEETDTKRAFGLVEDKTSESRSDSSPFGHSCNTTLTVSQLVILVILNIVSAALAVLAFVLFSAELALGWHHYSSDNDFAKCVQEGKTSTETCLYRGLNQIMLSVLQLCVTISFCVLTGKVLWKKDEDAKAVEDPELHKPLLEEDSAAPDEH